MKSYLGDPSLKEAFVAELKLHQEQDRFLKGTYSEGENGDFRGCAVGCGLHSLYNLGKLKERTFGLHSLFPKLLGIPEWLAYLQDGVFEGLSVEDSKWWPVAFAEAVPVGKDLKLVRHKILAYILEEETEFDRKKFPEVDKVVTDCAALHRRAASGERVTSAAWSAARSAAWSAVESAAWSAARSAAWSAVESAARSAVESAAESAAYKRVALKVIEILEAK